jgi:AAA domain-containing protein
VSVLGSDSKSVGSVKASSLLWSAHELATQFFPQTYLVEPIIPHGGICFFHGKRNIGKSQLALTLAICLSERGSLFGKYPTHAHGPVVYVQADMGAPLQQLRIRAIRRTYSLENLYFYFPRFFNLAQVTYDTPVISEIISLKPCVIIWDTLRKIQRLKTNDDDVPSFIYGKVQEMFPESTHFFVHHDKKSQVGDETLDQDEKFRGSGAWLDDADTGMHLSKIATQRLLLTFTKTRSCEEQPPVPLLLHPETLLLYSMAELQARKLAESWKQSHPSGTLQALEQYLLASFVASPRIVTEVVYGANGHAAGTPTG